MSRHSKEWESICKPIFFKLSFFKACSKVSLMIHIENNSNGEAHVNVNRAMISIFCVMFWESGLDNQNIATLHVPLSNMWFIFSKLEKRWTRYLWWIFSASRVFLHYDWFNDLLNLLFYLMKIGTALCRSPYYSCMNTLFRLTSKFIYFKFRAFQLVATSPHHLCLEIIAATHALMNYQKLKPSTRMKILI